MPSSLSRLYALLLALLLPASSALGEAASSAPAGQAITPGAAIAMDAFALTGSDITAEHPPSPLALEGFFAAAFHSEFGDTGRDALIRWEVPLRLYVRGEPTREDMNTLQTLLDNLKANVPGLPEMSFAGTETDANVLLSFVPYGRMAEYLATYEENNWGFMNCFSDDKAIRFGMIAIATDVTGQEDRNHLIQEEFINMLGLTADLDFAPESIIYQPYTRTQALAGTDYEMLNLLYSSFLDTGMSLEEAKAALKNAYPEH